jgi:nicotinamide mononucleotide adenylyltransferase
MSTLPLGVFYGRMNPYTRGHASVLNVINQNGRDPVIIVSHTQNGNKNPLTANQKINFIKRSLPGRRVKVMATSKNKPTIFHILHNLKVNNPNIKVYLGSNRIQTLGKSLEKAGYLVEQFGLNRTNTGTNLAGVSGTQARLAARTYNIPLFNRMATPWLNMSTRNSIMQTIRNQTQTQNRKKKRENTPSGNKPTKKKKRNNTSLPRTVSSRATRARRSAA